MGALAYIDGCIIGIKIPVEFRGSEVKKFNDIYEPNPEFFSRIFREFVAVYSSKYPQLKDLIKKGFGLYKVVQELSGSENSSDDYASEIKTILGQNVDESVFHRKANVPDFIIESDYGFKAESMIFPLNLNLIAADLTFFIDEYKEILLKDASKSIDDSDHDKSRKPRAKKLKIYASKYAQVKATEAEITEMLKSISKGPKLYPSLLVS